MARMKRLLAAMLVALAPLRQAAAADETAYAAYVSVDEAEILAGPGLRFYATQRLPRGTPVEIYREEPSGWLAIRPPEGSFSWVPGRFVERVESKEQVDGVRPLVPALSQQETEKDDSAPSAAIALGRVKQPVPAWIGTSVEHVGEHHHQVTLKAGELVCILGEKSVRDEDGRERVWIKIAPPAGEFRWIHLRDVSRQKPPVAESAGNEPSRQLAEGTARSHAESAVSGEPNSSDGDPPRRLPPVEPAIALRDIVPPAAPRDAAVELAQFRQSSASQDRKLVSPDGFVPRKRRGGERHDTVERPFRNEAVSSGAVAFKQDSPPLSAGPLARTAEDFARQLEQIEVELSEMLAQDRSRWNLAGMRRKVERLVEQGADPVSRGRARLVLQKIKQFQEAFDVDDDGSLAAGQPPASGSLVPAERSVGSYGQPGAEHARRAVTGTSLAADPHYDARGWLKPVISRKSDKPAAPYALVDQEGQPLCFVTPSPGVNLHRYLNKQVGVYGRRGYLEELKKPHVTAERVIVLDRQWR